MKIKIQQLNNMDRDAFTAALANIFEHSPWIPETTWEEKPFASLEALHQALSHTVKHASDEQQLNLIQAHPDLAGKLAIAGELTDESTNEQRSAQLDQLSAQQFERITALNDAYRKKFAFPFIICVKDHTQASIFEHFEQRVSHERTVEIEAALKQINRIAWHRLTQVVQS